jgi:phosphoribosylformimino-5-aminoimidazole carboxamide ribotide isomerase
MRIIPAIDLLNGSCVRLYQGSYAAPTIYDRDPVSTARRFADAGAERIHVVDLDAARGNPQTNRPVIAAIRRAVPAVLEVGGGIRRDEDAAELDEIGVDRMVIGTLLIRDPGRVAAWARRYRGKIIAGIDSRGGTVQVSGWEEDSSLSDLQAAGLAAESGAVSIIYTDIARDGTMSGPNLQRCREIARHAGLPVIVSGGVRGEEDFAALAAEDPALLPGIITGKALYERRFDLTEVLQRYQNRAETLPEEW